MRTLPARRPGRPGRRLISLTALAAVWCAAAILGAVPPAAAGGALANPTWTVSSSVTGATGVSYLFTFTTASTSSLNSVTMTVPTGTAGTPAVGTVSPVSLAGGTIALVSNALTYTFTATPVAAATFVSIKITGLTNTTAPGNTSTSTVTTRTGGTGVDAGTTATMAFTAANATLTSPTWSASSTAVGATGVSYTYTFTTPPAVVGTITSVTMTLPPGTSGTPTLGPVTPSGLLGGSISRSGTTLTYSGLSLLLLGSISVSIQVNGLVNTSAAGSYTSQIVVFGLLGALLYSGITPAVNLTGPLSLTSPASLTWAATLNGTNQSAFDTISGDQQFSLDDETNSGAGWHLTVAATTFTTGSRSLANSGTFSLNGSLSSATATTAPAASCVVSCTPPGNVTTYPAAITTAATSPTPAFVFDAPASTGRGPALISPVGWWVAIPASTRAGSYTSMVTVAVISGP
jgi:hypothetical protein